MTHLITILGSCRQKPVAEHVRVTNILDELNYPHYTKEVLQQIRYLKYNDIAQEKTRFCFRTGLLTRLPICSEKRMELASQFEATTLFLVEIASRLTYRWSNVYVHHVAHGDREILDSIVMEEQSDEEIEADIVKIRNELYPRPMVIVTHFATYAHGKRYELIQLLERISKRYSIVFLNQSNIVQQHGSQILVQEPVLAHYTDIGNKIVGSYLMSKIEEAAVPKFKPLYQVYYVSADRINKYAYHGFGDFVHGAIYLYQLCYETNNTNRELRINFSNHDLSSIFVCDNHLSIEECESAKYVFHHDQTDCLDYQHVFTNKRATTIISTACKSFIISKCLTPTIQFEKRLLREKDRLGLPDNYSVIHIRTIDFEMFSLQRMQTIVQKIDEITRNSSDTFLLLSNSDLYTASISHPSIKQTQLQKIHTGLMNSAAKCEDTMIEFMLMTTSKFIYQLSAYEWGSGFSDAVHNLYDIPMRKIKI